MKWLNSAFTTARAKTPGVASQVPVLTEPSSASNAGIVANVGEGWPPTAGGVEGFANFAAGCRAGATMCTMVMMQFY
jgi:hypothetical protein